MTSLGINDTAVQVLLGVLAVLILAAMVFCGTIAWVMLSAVRHLCELLPRVRANAADYYAMAVGESVARGRSNLAVAPPVLDDRQPTDPLSAMDNTLRGAMDDSPG